MAWKRRCSLFTFCSFPLVLFYKSKLAYEWDCFISLRRSKKLKLKFTQMRVITTKLVSKAQGFLCESISQGILDLCWDPHSFSTPHMRHPLLVINKLNPAQIEVNWRPLLFHILYHNTSPVFLCFPSLIQNFRVGMDLKSCIQPWAVYNTSF